MKVPVDKYLNKISASPATGYVKEILMNSEILDVGDAYHCYIDPCMHDYITKQRIEACRDALRLGKPLYFKKSKEPIEETPLIYSKSEKAEKMQDAYEEIKNDPIVQEVLEMFDAKIIAVKPL